MFRNSVSTILAVVTNLFFCPAKLDGFPPVDTAEGVGAVLFEIVKFVVIFVVIRFVIGLFVASPQN